jgi:hypothetical protein
MIAAHGSQRSKAIKHLPQEMFRGIQSTSEGREGLETAIACDGRQFVSGIRAADNPQYCASFVDSAHSTCLSSPSSNNIFRT